MSYYDFREYLDKLESAGELQHVRPQVDSNLEIGAIAQRLAERGGPAAHFWNVRNAAHGISWIAGSMSRGLNGIWSKLALALELDPDRSYHELLEDVHRRWESPVRPIQVGGGLCKQHVVRGDDVDLEALQAPLLHGQDGGRCLSSWSIVMAQHPDSGYVAWEVLPLQVSSDATLTGQLPGGGQLRAIYDRYSAIGQHMPFAIVLGVPPALTLAATFRARRGRGAQEIAGALQRQPLQLVKCETSELMVPASAEMVIEGFIRPGETGSFGPFPGTFGYRTASAQQAPVWHVSAITHRDKPILPLCPWGTPTAEIHIGRALDCDVNLKAEFERRGAPVRAVFTPPWLAGSVVAIAARVPFTAYAQSAAGIVRASEATKHVPYVLVCDDDIDITNPVALFHALVTKCHPSRDTWIIKQALAADDAPYLSASQRALGMGSAAIFDCTWPLDWDRSIAVPPKVSFEECYPPELQEKVLADWTDGLRFPAPEQRPI
ncbi:MAG: UbiD family decarboxylase [Gammaproteobacteria bacterium]|nr:UbiD family decarboxylase [Gammaproteobacteria bacterium]